MTTAKRPLKVLHVMGGYPTAKTPEALVMAKRQIDSLRYLGVDIRACVFDGQGWRKYSKGHARLRQMLRDEPFDIVHAHYAYVGWIARLQCQCPLVVSFMGSDVVGSFRYKGIVGWMDAVGHRLAAFLLSAISDASIVKSRRLGKWTVRGKTFVIPNGVDLGEFCLLNYAQCRQEVGFREDSKYVIFSCSESLNKPVKRLDLARAVVERVRESLPKVELIVLSGLSTEQVVKYLNAGDALLLTSRSEGSPNIIKEALACNLPIVSVDVGDVPERIKGVQGCYLAKPNPQDLADKLCLSFRSRRHSNGREKVADLALPRVAEKVLDVYVRILSRR